MTEVSFYHLTRRTLEQALPVLLEKSLDRDWRVVVQAVSESRMKKLDDWLWAYKPESFLPHGTKADGEPESQLIYLTCEGDNPNDADVRFFIEGARAAVALADAASLPRARAALMFDGADEAELQDARAQWKELKQAGHTLVYYQEDDSGKFIEKMREPKQ